jgi:hypothetical protein
VRADSRIALADEWIVGRKFWQRKRGLRLPNGKQALADPRLDSLATQSAVGAVDFDRPQCQLISILTCTCVSEDVDSSARVSAAKALRGVAARDISLVGVAPISISRTIFISQDLFRALPHTMPYRAKDFLT